MRSLADDYLRKIPEVTTGSRWELGQPSNSLKKKIRPTKRVIIPQCGRPVNINIKIIE